MYQRRAPKTMVDCVLPAKMMWRRRETSVQACNSVRLTVSAQQTLRLSVQNNHNNERSKIITIICKAVVLLVRFNAQRVKPLNNYCMHMSNSGKLAIDIRKAKRVCGMHEYAIMHHIIIIIKHKYNYQIKTKKKRERKKCKKYFEKANCLR